MQVAMLKGTRRISTSAQCDAVIARTIEELL
jgi:hypothetical protein